MTPRRRGPALAHRSLALRIVLPALVVLALLVGATPPPANAGGDRHGGELALRSAVAGQTSGALTTRDAAVKPEFPQRVTYTLTAESTAGEIVEA